MASFSTSIVEDQTGRVITNDAEAEDALADASAQIVRTCDEDGTAVTVSTAGTSEYAECRRGHRWQYNFNPGAGAGWLSI